MSSFRNAAKCNQKTHRERSQLDSRKHLGLLEKKKDYKKRADDFHKKETALKALRRKALDKNPDEFYFKMIRTRMEDGEHQCEDGAAKYTDEQLKLIQSQDLRYVQYKLSVERKKIERLKSNLHLIDVDSKPQKHLVFVDSDKEAASFDPAKFLNTHRDLLGRTYNRPKLDQLSHQAVKGSVDEDSVAAASVQRKQLYAQLCKRIEREKQLTIISQKLEVKKILIDKTVKRKKITEETVDAPAIYRQVYQRKR